MRGAERYKVKQYLISTGGSKAGGDGVSGRSVAGESGEYGEPIFLLKTTVYTVRVSFHLDPDGETPRGSIAAVVK